ncbi:hypothetical protein LTR62_000098 [Meristemomyces frigidus]|uniref:Uncharacterized protein n=1 Tax=Meristemomyces frigidus TaxID=1508187 RepID=A0AAN7YSW0_9PEZI|nr:hypothetical protein LTR62_000098 [Meristemomyces frigidus]
MPHKHTRKAGTKDDAHFNLAPTTKVRPLPAFAGVTKWKDAKKQQNGKKRAPEKPKQKTAVSTTTTIPTGYKEDDTPRAFARLMQFQTTRKRPSGLDDNVRSETKAKKRRKLDKDAEAKEADVTATVPEVKVDVPKIQPGERLADYAARVDQALPVSGLARKGKGAKIEGIKERQTKTEKRMQKMYASWREDDTRLKEKEEERIEEEEEKEDERRAMYGENYKGPDLTRALAAGNGKVEEDPWAVLKKKRKLAEAEAEAKEAAALSAQSEQTKKKKKGLKGVHDVVLAPPTIKVVPKEKFKVKNGAAVDVANVPGKAGSLKRREELGEARRDVIERYRAMMKQQKEG